MTIHDMFNFEALKISHERKISKTRFICQGMKKYCVQGKKKEGERKKNLEKKEIKKRVSKREQARESKSIKERGSERKKR